VLTETSPPDAEESTVAEPPGSVAAGPLRVLLLAAGFLFVGLATLGVFLPLLPTTPFLLLAAACFAKSSHRFYAMLLGNRIFGPLIRDWRDHRAIPLRAKLMAITAIALVMGSTAIFALEHPAGRAALLAFGAGLCAWLWRQPTREDVAGESEIA
jgi:uncharacterized membrane protein YbaN (DUF454 family)